MRRPLVEIYRAGEVDLVDDYVPGFREAEEQGNGLATGYDLEQIHANDGNPLTIKDHGSYHQLGFTYCSHLLGSFNEQNTPNVQLLVILGAQSSVLST